MKLMRYLKIDLLLQGSPLEWMCASPQPVDAGNYACDGCVDPP